MATKELIQQLMDRRGKLIQEERDNITAMESHADGPTPEEKTKAEQLDTEIADITFRIDELASLEEHSQEADSQRERFEKLIRTDTAVAQTHRETEERVRTWLRAGLPDAEVWAPRSITFNLERHDLTVGTATDGAELVPEGFVRRLYEHMVEMAAVRQTNATVLQTDGGESTPVPKTTTHGAAAALGEGDPIPEDDPQFAQVVLGAWKFGQLVQVSTELIQDTGVDLLGYLARACGRNIGLATGVQYVLGDGTTEPEGITLSGTAGKTGTTGQTTSVIAEDLIDLYHSVISGYRANSFWIMNDLSAAKIRKLRTDAGAGAGTGDFLWQASLSAGEPDRLLGRPVVTDPNMPVMAANALSIGFGDFSEYFVIRDVRQIRFERSDDFAFANDLVTFRCLFRTDSKQLVNGANGAVKFYKNSAT